jgi:DNA invertase Pin-like site-specific DNA recombinase
MFGMIKCVAEFERATIQERVRAGLARARSEGRQLGPSVIAEKAECAILAALSKKDGSRLRKITASFGVATITPPRRSMTPRSPASQV